MIGVNDMATVAEVSHVVAVVAQHHKETIATKQQPRQQSAGKVCHAEEGATGVQRDCSRTPRRYDLLLPGEMKCH
jgi:hypothetical protein